MTPYSERCTCRPGTEQNGWHEIRCGNCRAAESAVWADMMRVQREASNYARIQSQEPSGKSFIDYYLEYQRRITP